MADCQILQYTVRRKRSTGITDSCSKDLAPHIKRRRKALWFVDPMPLATQMEATQGSEPLSQCSCGLGVRRSRRLAKSSHQPCVCWREKENATEEDSRASLSSPGPASSSGTTSRPKLLEQRSGRQNKTLLKESLSVSVQKKEKTNGTSKSQRLLRLQIASPTTVLCSKFEVADFFDEDSEATLPMQSTANPSTVTMEAVTPLREIQIPSSSPLCQASSLSIGGTRKSQRKTRKACEARPESFPLLKVGGVSRSPQSDDSENPIPSCIIADEISTPKSTKKESVARHLEEEGDEDPSEEPPLCREQELSALEGFLLRQLKEKRPGCLYISGPPGTGKSMCVSHLIRSRQSSDLKDSVVISINCMSLRSPQAIFEALERETRGVKSLKKKDKPGNFRASSLSDRLRDLVCSSSKMIVLVLDELDQLSSRGQEVLYSVFEWPSLPNSKLILIGIANALDLTDRILPRLQMRSNCRPQLLHFTPYDKDQLISILFRKVEREVAALDPPVVFDPLALQFCARKVSAVHGDLRKAVDICRRAAEIAQTQDSRKVTVPLVARVVDKVYGSNIEECSEGLPLQQKMAICSFLLLTQDRKKKEVELGRFHDAYVKVCQRQKLKYESQAEFVDLCCLLETRGILSLKTAKERRHSKVSLGLQEGDVEHALKDQALLSSVLRNKLQ